MSVFLSNCGHAAINGAYRQTAASPVRFSNGAFAIYQANLASSLGDKYELAWLIEQESDSQHFYAAPTRPFGAKDDGTNVSTTLPPAFGWVPLTGVKPVPTITNGMSLEQLSQELKEYRPTWQQTMYRIKDPAITIPFYENNFGMRLLYTARFPQWDFDLYFLATPMAGVEYPEPGTPEAYQLLWSYEGVTLELTHNYGTENMPDLVHNNGNVEPNRGFGHIAFNTDDVYKATEELDARGVQFRKRPDEGRMKGLAFALDPDGYWVELVKREQTDLQYNLSQTMMRVKDPEQSLKFYCDMLGMTLVRASDYNDFSLYFVATLPPGTEHPDPRSQEAKEFVKGLFHPVLELTHNHGTEMNADFKHHNGNDDPRGFGHIGFLVENLAECCRKMQENGCVTFRKRPEDGNMHQIAFALDPDGYWVEIIQRGMVQE